MEEPTDTPKIHSIRDYMSANGESKQPTGLMRVHRPEGKCKILGLGAIHHRDGQGNTKTINTNFARLLDSNDDPLQRKFSVGEEWVPLETGWVKSVGYLILRNDGGKPFQVMPTKEQAEEELSRIIEVGYLVKSSLDNLAEREINPTKKKNRTHFDTRSLGEAEPTIPTVRTLWIIHPGEDMRGTPINDDIYLRCRHGEVTVTIMVVPN